MVFLQNISELHDDVEEKAAALSFLHREHLQCRRGCFDCCVDELEVFEIEAERIKASYAQFLKEAQPHPKGRCAFLSSEGACRIYSVRPYVCRTQGLPLRWIDDDEFAEYRDICPLNETGISLETLEEEQCWTLGEVEGQLATLQHQHQGGGELRRVALRSLFQES